MARIVDYRLARERLLACQSCGSESEVVGPFAGEFRMKYLRPD
jgi:hypothetical protein